MDLNGFDYYIQLAVGTYDTRRKTINLSTSDPCFFFALRGSLVEYIGKATIIDLY